MTSHAVPSITLDSQRPATEIVPPESLVVPARSRAARECGRCLVTDEVPGATVDVHGICSVCREHDASLGMWSAQKAARREKLEHLLAIARAQKRPYDVLVPLSGGKDSAYVLYLMRKRYDMRCLAVTFDNGFLSSHARRNIQVATRTLDVDHVYFEMSRLTLMRVYRTFFLRTGMFCPACMRGIAYSIDLAAASFRIPLIATGTSRRTEEHLSSDFFVPDDAGYFNAVMADAPASEHAGLGYRGHWLRRYPGHFLNPARQMRLVYGVKIDVPDYWDWNYEEVFTTVQRELGWTAATDRAEHADCRVDSVVQYMRYRKFPVLRPELLRYSKLATIGAMTKAEARARVDAMGTVTEPSSLPLLLDSLGITRHDFDAAMNDPFRHRPYLARATETPRARARNLIAQARGTIGDWLFG